MTRTIDRSQDSLLRSTGYELKAGSTVEAATGYTYHAGRGVLQGVAAAGVPNLTGKSYAWEYGWQAKSPGLIDTVTGPVHTVDNDWESSRDVLASKANTRTVGGTALLSKKTYSVNGIGQRGGVVLEGLLEDTFYSTGTTVSTSTDWTYDSMGQLKTQDRTGTTYDRAWKYDGIGNRTRQVTGSADPDATYPGVATGQTLYSPNAANQYASTTANASTAVDQAYDGDGNLTLARTFLTANGEYTWNTDNRLIQSKVTTGGTALLYSYDAIGRRIGRRIYSSTGTLTDATLYCYEGWNLIGEYNLNLSTSAWALARAYTWGLDLSGSMQGAGGVGGLLAVTVGTPGSTTGPTGTFYPIYDGNGNVEAYLTSTGGFQAIYQYNAFGSAQTGATAISSTNQVHFFHRFSTKYQDEQSKLLYYGYRYYDPYLGRWLNRDPIEEEGGANLYGFVGNEPTSGIDNFGLKEVEDLPWLIRQLPKFYWDRFQENLPPWFQKTKLDYTVTTLKEEGVEWYNAGKTGYEENSIYTYKILKPHEICSQCYWVYEQTYMLRRHQVAMAKGGKLGLYRTTLRYEADDAKEVVSWLNRALSMASFIPGPGPSLIALRLDLQTTGRPGSIYVHNEWRIGTAYRPLGESEIRWDSESVELGPMRNTGQLVCYDAYTRLDVRGSSSWNEYSNEHQKMKDLDGDARHKSVYDR